MLKHKELSDRVMGAAIEVHRALGPGLLESAYKRALCAELAHQGLPFETEVPVDAEYRGKTIPRAYFADIVVDGLIVLELKAVPKISPVAKQQLLTYMRFLDLEVGYLLNFNAENLMREGRTRRIL